MLPLRNKHGQPIIVDEMDLPVLNLGSGDKALQLQENFLGPRGPVINVDLAAQPNLTQNGRQAQGPVFTEMPGGQPFHHTGDATDLQALSALSPTGKFREIHSINPYGFYPHPTFPLLNMGGSLHVTGNKPNKYAKLSDAVRNETALTRFGEISQTQQGIMRDEHARLPQTHSDSTLLNTTTSRTYSIFKK